MKPIKLNDYHNQTIVSVNPTHIVSYTRQNSDYTWVLVTGFSFYVLETVEEIDDLICKSHQPYGELK